jgi:hypothetical protein
MPFFFVIDLHFVHNGDTCKCTTDDTISVIVEAIEITNYHTNVHSEHTTTKLQLHQ